MARRMAISTRCFPDGPMAKTAIISARHESLSPGGTTPRTPRCPRWRADGLACAGKTGDGIGLPGQAIFGGTTPRTSRCPRWRADGLAGAGKTGDGIGLPGQAIFGGTTPRTSRCPRWRADGLAGAGKTGDGIGLPGQAIFGGTTLCAARTKAAGCSLFRLSDGRNISVPGAERTGWFPGCGGVCG